MSYNLDKSAIRAHIIQALHRAATKSTLEVNGNCSRNRFSTNLKKTNEQRTKSKGDGKSNSGSV
eukprot:1584802-Amphidinium_carterae.1